MFYYSDKYIFRFLLKNDVYDNKYHFNTAVDFRGRLRFPRASVGPPFLIPRKGTVQLQGLEAHVISQTDQEGKERLSGRSVLCSTPLFKALSIF